MNAKTRYFIEMFVIGLIIFSLGLGVSRYISHRLNAKSPVDQMLTYDGKYHTPVISDTVGVVTHYGAAGLVKVQYRAVYAEELFDSGVNHAISAAIQYAVRDIMDLATGPFDYDEAYTVADVIESNVMFLMSATLENVGLPSEIDIDIVLIEWPNQFIKGKGAVG